MGNITEKKTGNGRDIVRNNCTYALNGIRRRKTQKIVDPAVLLLSITEPNFIRWLEAKAGNGIKPARLVEYCLVEAWRTGQFDTLCQVLGNKVRRKADRTEASSGQAVVVK